MSCSNARLYDGKAKVMCSDIIWHKNHVLITIQIKSGHRCSDLTILLIVPVLVLKLLTDAVIG